MSYRVVFVKVVGLIEWEKRCHLELACRVEDNGEWVHTSRWRYPYPCWFDDLEHDLMIHFDVGNVRLQQHLEYFVPHEQYVGPDQY